MDNKQKGKNAENLAGQFYLKKGYTICDQNYRFLKGEIDLIVQMGQLIVFVEVKYRSGLSFGHPEEFVSENQQRLILDTAEYYLHEKEWNGNVRFDIISINKKLEITQFEDVFF